MFRDRVLRAGRLNRADARACAKPGKQRRAGAANSAPLALSHLISYIPCIAPRVPPVTQYPAPFRSHELKGRETRRTLQCQEPGGRRVEDGASVLCGPSRRDVQGAAGTLPTSLFLSHSLPLRPPDRRAEPDELHFFLNLFLKKKKISLLGRDESPSKRSRFRSESGSASRAGLSISSASLVPEPSKVLW